MTKLLATGYATEANSYYLTHRKESIQLVYGGLLKRKLVILHDKEGILGAGSEAKRSQSKEFGDLLQGKRVLVGPVEVPGADRDCLEEDAVRSVCLLVEFATGARSRTRRSPRSSLLDTANGVNMPTP